MPTNPPGLPLLSAFFDGSGDPKNGPKLVASLGKITREWVGYLGGLSSIAAVVAISDTTLTVPGPTTITALAPTVEGALMAQILRQQNGGSLIAWDSKVFQSAPTDIAATMGSESVFLFLGHNGQWLYLSSWTGSGSGPAVQYGSRAARAGASQGLTDGELWVEIDTGLIYQWRAGSGWYFASGPAYPRTQSQLAAFAAPLGVADAGLTVDVTDYAHALAWSGSGWEWAPGEQGSGMLVACAIAPTGNGWHACDGSAGVAYLKSDGTTGTVTLPNTASAAAYLKAGSAYAASITAAVAPTISAPAFSGTPGTTSAPSATELVTIAGAGSTATGTHTHTLTPAGTVSAPTATLPGDPIANFEVLLYFRQ